MEVPRVKVEEASPPYKSLMEVWRSREEEERVRRSSGAGVKVRRRSSGVEVKVRRRSSNAEVKVKEGLGVARRPLLPSLRFLTPITPEKSASVGTAVEARLSLVASSGLKCISLSPVRRSFRARVSSVEGEGMGEDLEEVEEDDVFIRDLDNNFTHRLKLGDLPHLPAVI